MFQFYPFIVSAYHD